MGPDTRPDADHRNRPLCWPATVTIRTMADTGPFQLVLGSATARDELRRLVEDSVAHDEPVTSIIVDAGSGPNATVARWEPGTIVTNSHRHGWRTHRRASHDPVEGVDEAIAAAGADGRPLCEYCSARAARRLYSTAGRWACRAHLHLALADAHRDPSTDAPLHIDERRRVVCTDAAPTKTVLCGTCGHEIVIPADSHTCPICTLPEQEATEAPGSAAAVLCDPCRHGRHPHTPHHTSHCECACIPVAETEDAGSGGTGRVRS